MCKTRVSVSLVLWILFSVSLPQPYTKLLPSVTQNYLLSLVYTPQEGTSLRSCRFFYLTIPTQFYIRYYVELRNKAPRGKTGRSFLPYALSIQGGDTNVTWTWDTSSGSLFSSWAQGHSSPGFAWVYPGGKDQTIANKMLLLHQFVHSWLCLTCTTYRV